MVGGAEARLKMAFLVNHMRTERGTDGTEKGLKMILRLSYVRNE